METRIVTTFKLGQSTVVTLPKNLGIIPGTKLQYTKIGNSLKLSPSKIVETKAKRIEKALAYVKKNAGSIKYKAKAPYPTLKEMSDAYEKDTYGDLLPGY